MTNDTEDKFIRLSRWALTNSRQRACQIPQMVEELRVRLCNASRIFDFKARDLQAGNRKRHRNAMVVISLYHRLMKQ